MVTDFLLAYARLIAAHPDALRIDVAPLDEASDEITLYAHSEDVGRLIGKEGKMIGAIKTVISGCKAKGAKNYRINIKPID